MEEPTPELLVKILRDCAATSDPLYPGPYAETHFLDRATLDRGLDRLRLGGLLRLTDWVAGKGQGYLPTDEGRHALTHPNLLALMTLANQLAAEGKLKPPDSAPTDPYQPTPGTRPNAQRRDAVRASLPERPPREMTVILVALNVVAFVLGALLAWERGIPFMDYLNPVFQARDPNLPILLNDLGALSPYLTAGARQWWRLLSYCFVHGGITHLLMNMYFLYSLGPTLEGMWGRWRFLYLYILSGIGGGVAVLLAESMAVGALGSLCGLLTSMLVWVWLNRPYLNEEASGRWLRNIVANIVLITLISLAPGVSSMGHLGGAVAGLALAFPMVFQRFGVTSQQRLLGLAGMLVVPGVIVGACVGVELERGDGYRLVLIQPPAHHAENLVVETHNKQLLPLMSIFEEPRSPLPKDPKKLQDARQAFARAAEQIAQDLGQIHAVPTMRDDKLRQEIDQLGAYLEGFRALFERLAQALEHPETLTADQRRQLHQDILQQRAAHEARVRPKPK